MPEIKNTFTQGKMNKDLDERIVPNGQYRDAMNIQVSTSEGSDVGAVQNILGNNRIGDIVDTGWECVGSITDEKNDVLYSFITHTNIDRSAIMEYAKDPISGTMSATPVLVDLNNDVLNFSEGDIITGINVIDEFLLWTDGNSEPKKINIQRCKDGTPDFATHTKLWLGPTIGGAIVVDANGTQVDITEEYITVIKKNPLRPLSIKINPEISEAGQQTNQKPLFEKIFPRFSYRYRYEDGEYSTFAPFTDVVFESLYGNDQAGTAYDNDNAYGVDEPYNNGMRNMIRSVELTDFISPNIPKDVVQVDLLYKQENSSVVYVLEVIESDNAKWTENGFNPNSAYKGNFTVISENIYAALPENQLLRPWDNVPKVALAQEVTGNRLVYGNYKQGYNLIDINENKVNPTTISEYGFRDVDSDNLIHGGLPSVKSQRHYQIGIVYGDKYGRETPVFTNEDAFLTIPWGGNLASQNLQLKTNMQDAYPEWASYYKFFVKETSGEYYNLAMDAVYSPTKEDLTEDNHVWLSFASSDRNKVSEEDYIILKRKIGEEAQVEEENKYKILDIKNEAPDAIKYKYLKLGEVDNTGNKLNETIGNGGIFYDEDFRPGADKDHFYIHKTNWQATGLTKANGMSLTENDETTKADDLFVSWTNTGGTENETTERYKVASIRISSGNIYIIQLEKSITTEDGLLITQPATSTAALHDDVIFKVERKLVKNLEAFSGRFFVKIFGKGIVTTLQDANEIRNIFTTTNTQNIHWHADVAINTFDPDAGLINNGTYDAAALDNTDETSTIANQGTPTTSAPITKTEVGWDNILTSVKDTSDATNTINQFFIDNMYMVASQPSVDSEYGGFARHSGQGWYGGNPLPVGDIIYAAPLLGYTNTNTWNGNQNPPAGYSEAFGALTDIDGLAWPTNSDITLQTLTTTTNGDNMVNGIPGVIVTNDDHNGSEFDNDGNATGIPNGIRRWKKSIHNTDLTTWDYGNAPSHNGKNIIHLSFLAPGEDLHDGSGWDNLDFRNLPGKLQGIYGGGVFTKDDGTTFPSISNIGGSDWLEGIHCEREYNYLIDGMNNSIGTPISEIDPDIDSPPHTIEDRRVGYHPSYKDKHRNQWKPWESGGTYNATIHAFVQALKTPGQKFRFKDDPTEAVYTIQRVAEKRIYNHTPWRRMYKHDNSGGLVATGESVEEAAVTWANTRSSSNTDGDTTERDEFKTKVEEFGKANNRRVCYIIHLDPISTPVFPVNGGTNPTITTSASTFNSLDAHLIEFVDEDFNLLDGKISQNPAIWETEPKDNVDLDIYYEAGQAYPTTLTEESKELFAPIGSVVSFPEDSRPFNGIDANGSLQIITGPVSISNWDGLELIFSEGINQYWDNNGSGESINYVGMKIRFTRQDGSYTTATVLDSGGVSGGFIKRVTIQPTTETGLGWYNCFSFGNGVESNRIRDDFNAMTITNGVRANSTIDRPYTEEHRKSGLIYSGLYNSSNRVNNLNQFIMAEKITKDLNPTYGSIQKLFSRRISLIAFCEDRVVKIIANKNALYNADGNPQLVATNAVLGDANPFVGDYGISQNPESFAKDSYRAYFTDKQRGAVLRLSMDGLTPISDAGMSDWFKDEFKNPGYNFIGSFDNYKNDYNLTLDGGSGTSSDSYTLTFSEDVRGWTSFKSFIQESGTSMSGDYYTFKGGKCWKHDNETRNTFYTTEIGGGTTSSSITFLLNESPLVIKNYNTLNYDGEEGWQCDSITTDQESGTVTEFIEKEGKWFNYISGDSSAALDTSAFNFQGIGTASNITYD